MGLAGPKRSNRWFLRSDFESILRAQRTDDRQQSLAAHAVPASDPRLPSRVTDLGNVQQLEGRVLGHGEEESTGRTYLILEGTDRYIHFIYRSAELDAARGRGKLNTNSFVRLTAQLVNQKFITKVQYFGDSNQLLSNKHNLQAAAQSLLKRGIISSESGTAGWLGKYETKLAHTLRELQAGLMKSGKETSIVSSTRKIFLPHCHHGPSWTPLLLEGAANGSPIPSTPYLLDSLDTCFTKFRRLLLIADVL